MKQKSSRRHGCLTMLIILFVLGLIILMIRIFGPHVAPNMMARLSRDELPYGRDEFPSLNEVRAYGYGPNKTVLVRIHGMIRLDDEGGLFAGPSPAAQALAAIRRATLDPDVMALILDIDSGGGGITASDVLLNAIRRFRNSRPDRRVVAICGDLAASGAYYIALGADHIIAHPTTVTGSIGVMIQTLNLRELGHKLGIRGVTIKSGPDKDLLNPLEEMTPAQQMMLQRVVDGLHDRFVRLVSDQRQLPVDQVRELADGRIMLGPEALATGLIDEVGYWSDAVLRTAELLHVDRIAIYRYEVGFSFSNLLRARLAPRPAAGWIGEAVDLIEGRSPFQYRWSY